MSLFILQRKKYSIGDPALLLDREQLDELMEQNLMYGALSLDTDNGIIIAVKVEKKGVFDTDKDRSIETQSGYIAFVPAQCVRRRNLVYQSIDITFQEPTIMYALPGDNIIVVDTLTIYCTDHRPDEYSE